MVIIYGESTDTILCIYIKKVLTKTMASTHNKNIVCFLYLEWPGVLEFPLQTFSFVLMVKTFSLAGARPGNVDQIEGELL